MDYGYARNAQAIWYDMSSISKYQLETIIRHVKRDLRDAPDIDRWVEAAKRILRKFLGEEWINQHISSKNQGFFAGFQESTTDTTGARRVIEAANMMLNFQNLEGFSYSLRSMRTGNVESEYASLEVAKMLYCSATRFRFNVPAGIKGEDFDFEAFPSNGPAVPIEAKCKSINANLTENGIRNILNNHTDQLPPGRPGLMVLRVPREWTNEDFMETPFAKVAQGVLRNSSRVAGIIILSNHFVSIGSTHTNMHVARHFWSQRKEFEGVKEWKVFRSDIQDNTGSWMHIRFLMGDLPYFGVTAAKMKERLKGRVDFDFGD